MPRSFALRSTAAAFAAALALVAGPLAAAEEAPAAPHAVTIVDTPGPGGVFGTNGFDVFVEQAVAARFTVPADGNLRLKRVGLWLMNNSDTVQKKLRVSVQTDALDEGGSESLPSGVMLEQWTAPVKTFGWNPVEQFFVSRTLARLKAGHSYWVVAESKSPPFVDPVWTFARKGTMVTTTTSGGAWQPAGEGAALTLQVEGYALAD